MDYDYTHPERYVKDLVFAPNGEVPDEVKEQRKKLLLRGRAGKEVQLCWACGWTAYQQLLTSYTPRIKVLHVRDNIGIWTLGSNWLLVDQPNDETMGNDFITQEFLKQQPGVTIPLPQQIRFTKPTDQIQFTLMSRVQGETLGSVWSTLSPEQKANYRKQLGEYIKQLRQFTAPAPMKVDGSPLDDVIIGFCHRRRPPTCKKIGATADEWFENISDELRHGLYVQEETKDPAIIDARLKVLRDGLPDGGPYVLTHADLNLTNIIVKDDKIQGIIDWEMAGYYPWWAEQHLSHLNADPQVHDVFGPLWDEICPEMDTHTFFEQIASKILALSDTFEECPKEHPGEDDVWLLPGFCECKPYAGEISCSAVGQALEHKIGEPKPPLTMLDYFKSLGPRKFSQ